MTEERKKVIEVDEKTLTNYVANRLNTYVRLNRGKEFCIIDVLAVGPLPLEEAPCYGLYLRILKDIKDEDLALSIMYIDLTITLVLAMHEMKDVKFKKTKKENHLYYFISDKK
ncbi:MAG: hypothetical protein N4A32_00760 [Marinifilaceae bacterium]|jgi:hypothetical protein|nr:hypothetical protein [Marinifilaceae bacterium]